jgi:hypothetical protein
MSKYETNDKKCRKFMKNEITDEIIICIKCSYKNECNWGIDDKKYSD